MFVHVQPIGHLAHPEKSGKVLAVTLANDPDHLVVVGIRQQLMKLGAGSLSGVSVQDMRKPKEEKR